MKLQFFYCYNSAADCSISIVSTLQQLKNVHCQRSKVEATLWCNVKAVKSYKLGTDRLIDFKLSENFPNVEHKMWPKFKVWIQIHKEQKYGRFSIRREKKLKTWSDRQIIALFYEIRDANDTNGDVRIVTRKLGNSSFCACTVQIWLNTVINTHRLPRYPLRNRWVCRLVYYGRRN